MADLQAVEIALIQHNAQIFRGDVQQVLVGSDQSGDTGQRHLGNDQAIVDLFRRE